VPLLLSIVLLIATPTPAAVRILRHHECARCHQVEGVAQPSEEQSCARCHIAISTSENDPQRMAKGREEFGPAWDRFVDRTGEHYTHVPSLTGMQRFQASWLRSFLLSPYDLRPNLGESMIRHNLTDQEIETLIRGWGAHDEPAPAAPAAEQIAAGAKLFEQKACATCHLFGNAAFATAGDLVRTFTPRNPLRALAPDLRHVRDRLARTTVERWIQDSRSVKPDSIMPAQTLTAEEARLIADYLFFGEPGKPATVATHRPPAYDPRAPVPTFEEVDAKVFGVLCVHCHEEPHLEMGASGDGGPGNTGGFGFKGSGLSFESYATLIRGTHGSGGKRVSVFRDGPGGEPVLLERVRQRYVENDRDFVRPGQDPLLPASGQRATTPRGMPLVLPALSDEQFSLLERWVRGGHPGPKAP
jgi:hypothetical protein